MVRCYKGFNASLADLEDFIHNHRPHGSLFELVINLKTAKTVRRSIRHSA